MNKTIILFLIGLLSMPSMAVAETSKELEEAIEKAKKEISPLFDSNDVEAYTEKAHQLMDLCKRANDEKNYYKTWSNLATFTFRFDPQKAIKLAEEMRDDAKEHDSKFGIVTALYTQANMSVKVGMSDRAVELCNQAIEYKTHYLPKVNCTHIFWMLAKIYLVNNKPEEALEALDKCQKEPDLTPYQQMNIMAFRCEAAFLKEPIDTALFMSNYNEVQRLKKETGKNSEFITGLDIHYAELTGQYEKMLILARQNPNKTVRYQDIYKAYRSMGRWKEAFDTLSIYIKARDSITTAETRKQIEIGALELEAVRAENEAQTLRLEKQQLTLIGILVLAIFLVLYWWSRHRAAIRLGEVKAEQERIQSELRIAREIQMSMVPSLFPERDGLYMSAYMNPAREVGGDLYGYLLQGDKLYFAVGDVSGKGVPASLFMAQATRLFQTLAKQGMMPAEICTRMNDALSGEDNDSGMFVTFWLGLVDLQTGHLHYCNAGHNPPVIGGGDHHGDFLKMISNAPIGLWPELQYEGEEIDTIKNRPLFIYTDGLNEAEDPQREQFGNDRLLQTLRHTQFEDPQQVIESLKHKVEDFRNGAEPNDDLTMMCLYVS